MRRQKPKPGAIIVIATLIALSLKLFVLDFAVIDGPSMLPSYKAGDVVAVLRCAYGLRLPSGAGTGKYFLRWGSPRQGEVVAALRPGSDAVVVKRVAATGPAKLCAVGSAHDGAVLDLPAGSVFLLGDNMPESMDSRSYGAVSVEAVAGRVLGSHGRRRHA
jgi:hypothetical protein